MLFDNPEFVRLVRTKLRGKSVIILGVSSAAIFGGLLAILQYGINQHNDLYTGYFFATVGIQCGLGSLYALMLASQNITMEKEKNTYDFQRLVAMGPWRLGLGKLMGAACEAYVGIGVGAFFAFVPVMAGVIPSLVWLKAQIVVVVFTFVVTSFGLMASSIVAKTAHAAGITIFLILGLISSIGIGVTRSGGGIWVCANPARIFAELYQSVFQPNYIVPHFHFFGGSLPMMGCFLAINLSVAALCFTITVRRLIDDELSLVRLKHAAIAFVLFEALFIGSCWDLFAVDALSALASFHFMNALLLLALAFALMPSSELLRGRVSRGTAESHWRIFFERTNSLQDSPPLTAILLFCAAYAGMALTLTIVLNFITGPALATIVMVSAMGIATAAMLLYVNIYLEKNGLKIGAAILVGALTFPPVIAGNFMTQKLTALSPFAYLSYFANSPEMNSPYLYVKVKDMPSPYTCPILCLSLAVLFSLLAAMRIRFLLDLDEAQRKHDLQEAEAASKKPLALRVAAARALVVGPVMKDAGAIPKENNTPAS